LRTSTTITKLAAVTTTTLVLGGCGGGGGSSSGGDSGQIRSSITAFIQKHDCSALTPAFQKQLTGETDVKACDHDLSLRNKVKQLSIGAVSVSGDSATAAVTTDGTKVGVQLVKQSGRWLINGTGSPQAPGQTTATTPGTPTTTTPSSGSADTAAAKADYAAELATLRAARASFKTRVLADLRARNLSAVTGDFGRYRDALFNFDAKVRKINFPASAGDAVTALLEANRTEISDLDATSSASSFSEISRLLTKRLSTDDNTLTGALQNVTSSLSG